MLKRLFGKKPAPTTPVSPSCAAEIERDSREFGHVMREIERKVMARHLSSTDELDLPSHRSA